MCLQFKDSRPRNCNSQCLNTFYRHSTMDVRGSLAEDRVIVIKMLGREEKIDFFCFTMWTEEAVVDAAAKRGNLEREYVRQSTSRSCCCCWLQVSSCTGQLIGCSFSLWFHSGSRCLSLATIRSQEIIGLVYVVLGMIGRIHQKEKTEKTISSSARLNRLVNRTITNRIEVIDFEIRDYIRRTERRNADK